MLACRARWDDLGLQDADPECENVLGHAFQVFGEFSEGAKSYY